MTMDERVITFHPGTVIVDDEKARALNMSEKLDVGINIDKDSIRLMCDITDKDFVPRRDGGFLYVGAGKSAMALDFLSKAQKALTEAGIKSDAIFAPAHGSPVYQIFIAARNKARKNQIIDNITHTLTTYETPEHTLRIVAPSEIGSLRKALAERIGDIMQNVHVSFRNPHRLLVKSMDVRAELVADLINGVWPVINPQNRPGARSAEASSRDIAEVIYNTLDNYMLETPGKDISIPHKLNAALRNITSAQGEQLGR